MKQITLLIHVILLTFLAGCINIPDEHYTIGHNGNVSLADQHPLCENKKTILLPTKVPPTSNALTPDAITLLNWNSYKGKKESWLETFTALGSDRDLITLQEGYIDKGMYQSLLSNNFTWDITAAFTQDKIQAGVLTASKVSPSALCSFWHKEPILSIPKTAMITLYELEDNPQSLMLINVHMINFTMGTKSFREQLAEVEQVINQHDGPIILAGDFNTWNTKRQVILEELITKVSLEPVSYTEDHRTRFMGEAVDHVFTRGLDVINANTLVVDASDHNPILATFSVQAEI